MLARLADSARTDHRSRYVAVDQMPIVEKVVRAETAETVQITWEP